eukprot:GHRR01022327.1.p1 GENE.GHRR01022327.1~~GHRR01022327.1.p1  ORF type:complete len:147 (+),score=27.33 GHRR01022327.1:90-530(+)
MPSSVVACQHLEVLKSGTMWAVQHRCLSGSSVCQPTRPRQLHRRSCVSAVAAASRTDALRELLKSPTILKGPCCHDAISARLIERAGFDFAFMSGFCTSAARLGAPDTGLISYAEMADQVGVEMYVVLLPLIRPLLVGTALLRVFA